MLSLHIFTQYITSNFHFITAQIGYHYTESVIGKQLVSRRHSRKTIYTAGITNHNPSQFQITTLLNSKFRNSWIKNDRSLRNLGIAIVYML
jgi:hypothetical protein